MLWNFRAAARRRATGVDLVHAHWLPTGLVALPGGKPFILQLWGTDVELARRARGVRAARGATGAARDLRFATRWPPRLASWARGRCA